MVLVDKVNEYISILDNGGMVRFFNMRDTYYVGDGVFNNNLFDPDMIHLSGEGYSAWNMSMDALFTEMWNSKWKDKKLSNIFKLKHLIMV